MNLSTKQKQTLRHREQMCDCQAGGGWAWEFGISMCKLLSIGWINSKVLLYSTGNYIQHQVINRNGKEYLKRSVYMSVTESLCRTAEIGTTLQISYTSGKKARVLLAKDRHKGQWYRTERPKMKPQDYNQLILLPLALLTYVAHT